MRAIPGLGRPAAFILVAALASLACSDGSTPTEGPAASPALGATSSTTHFTFDIDEVSFVSCTGEDVHWTGSIDGVEHTVANRGVDPAGQGQHFLQNSSVHSVGVGLTTGGSYRFNSVQRFDLQSETPINPYPASVKFLRKDVLIGPGGGAIGWLTVGFRLVINGNNQVVLDREDLDFTIECK